MLWQIQLDLTVGTPNNRLHIYCQRPPISKRQCLMEKTRLAFGLTLHVCTRVVLNRY
jgi:hypothetical protein